MSKSARLLIGARGVRAFGVASGSLAFGVVDTAARAAGWPELPVMSGMFGLYGLLALAAFALYLRLPRLPPEEEPPRAPLGPSRRRVLALAGLFSVDAFGSGFIQQSMLALWLFQRFHLSLAAAGTFFFWTGVLGAFSQFAAGRLARRIGLINTMVFTHIPANLCLVLTAAAPSLPAAIALLLVRAALQQMDVPARTSYVMAVVTPAERAAAAGVTNVPRSLAAAASPTLAGALIGAGAFAAPLLIGGGLKITYDLLLLAMFRKVRPPEEGG